jgi:hypothetical protein
MPLVVQDPTTGRFVAPNGRWTRNLKKAMSFDQVLRAWDEIAERGLLGVRILLKRGNDDSDWSAIARVVTAK